MTAKQCTGEKIVRIACLAAFEVVTTEGEKVEKAACSCLGNVSTALETGIQAIKYCQELPDMCFRRRAMYRRAGIEERFVLAQAAHGLRRVVEVDGIVATGVGSRDQISKVDIDFPDFL